MEKGSDERISALFRGRCLEKLFLSRECRSRNLDASSRQSDLPAGSHHSGSQGRGRRCPLRCFEIPQGIVESPLVDRELGERLGEVADRDVIRRQGGEHFFGQPPASTGFPSFVEEGDEVDERPAPDLRVTGVLRGHEGAFRPPLLFRGVRRALGQPSRTPVDRPGRDLPFLGEGGLHFRWQLGPTLCLDERHHLVVEVGRIRSHRRLGQEGDSDQEQSRGPDERYERSARIRPEEPRVSPIAS